MGRSRRLVASAALAAVAIAAGCNALSGVGDLTVCSGEECTDASFAPTATSGGSNGSSSSSSSSSSSTSSAGGTTSSSSSSSSSGSDASDCTRSEPGLVAYYPLDEGSGATTVKDCSGHGHDGNVLSAGTWGAGKFGGAFTTTDSSGCIDLGTPAELLLEGSSFTVAVWGSAQVFGTAQLSYYLVGRTALPQSAGWRLGTDPGNQWSAKLFDATNGLTFVGSAPDQPTGTWTHVAATFAKDGLVTLYINGTKADSIAYTSTTADNTATIRIGCRGDDKGYLHGSIDEVRIYATVLDAAAIAALAAKTP